MTEEINYSYDGGLYGELVNSRVIGSHWGALEHWVAVTQGDAQASIEVDQKDGPSAALPRSLKLTVKQAGNAEEAGVQNDGYWGIPVRPDTTYQASFYAKADSPVDRPDQDQHRERLHRRNACQRHGSLRSARSGSNTAPL